MYHATSASEWAGKLDDALNATGAGALDALVVGHALSPKYPHENTTASVGDRFAALRRRGVNKVAVFDGDARSAARDWGLPAAVVAEWTVQLRAFARGGASVAAYT
jgi:hypothetical protein